MLGWIVWDLYYGGGLEIETIRLYYGGCLEIETLGEADKTGLGPKMGP